MQTFIYRAVCRALCLPQTGKNAYISPMTQVKKFFAGLGAVGALLLALYLAAFLFVVLLIVGGVAAIWLKFKMGKARKEFEKHQANRSPGVIEGEYVVVEDRPLDVNPERRS